MDKNFYSDFFRSQQKVETVTNPGKDRSLPGKARVKARRGRAPESPKPQPMPLMEPTEPEVAKYGLRELEEKKVSELRDVAKELGITGVSKLRKDDLVEEIYRSDKNVR